jgi:2'-5' RNA ligase
MTNHYFLAHEIEHAEVFTKITKDIATHFKIKNVSTRLVPHITLKAPFNLRIEDSAQLENILTKFAEDPIVLHTQRQYRIEGFGHFDSRVIHARVHDIDIRGLTVPLCEQLAARLHIPTSKHEPITTPHITLAKNDISAHWQDILVYLNSIYGDLSLIGQLDSLSLLELRKDGWKVIKKFRFANM